MERKVKEGRESEREMDCLQRAEHGYSGVVGANSDLPLSRCGRQLCIKGKIINGEWSDRDRSL